MAVRSLDESNRLFAVEVDMENRSPEEIARDAVMQINALFDRLIKEQQEKDDQSNILTETETEIVRAIAQGKTTKEIANERYSSIHTITTHRKNIFRKLGVNTAHEVIKYALRAGLVDSSEFYI